MTGPYTPSLEALRREFEYRIRTAVTYGLGRGTHGDSADQDVAGWIDREIGAAMASLTVSQVIEAARAEERERCAQIADSVGHHWSGLPAKAAFEAAERIREQGKEQDR